MYWVVSHHLLQRSMKINSTYFYVIGLKSRFASSKCSNRRFEIFSCIYAKQAEKQELKFLKARASAKNTNLIFRAKRSVKVYIGILPNE